MRVLISLLIALVVVSFSSAQESSERLVPQQLAGSESDGAKISEPTAGEIAKAGEGDQRSLAALEALQEGNELWRSGDIEQSSLRYQRAINLDPSLYSAQFNLGLAFLRTKEYRRAVGAFTVASRLKPESAPAWKSLGFANYYREHYDKAVEAFREAQRLSPDDRATNSNLGFTYLFVGRFRDAVTSFQNALKLDPRFRPATKGLCTAHALARNAVDAVQACLNAATADSDSAVPHYFLGVAYMDLGETEKALSALQKAARIEPHTARIQVGLGFACFKLRSYDEAIKHFEHATKSNERAQALLGLGATYARLKDYKKAETALREALSSNPNNPIAHFNLGIVCLARGNRDCALSQYNRLKIMDHPLAKTLFTTLFQDRIVDASRYTKPSP
jgi:tetratricopeptide (TPR) repeat protein